MEQPVEFERRRGASASRCRTCATRTSGPSSGRRRPPSSCGSRRGMAVVELPATRRRALGDASGVDAAAPRRPRRCRRRRRAHPPSTRTRPAERPASSGGGPSTAPPADGRGARRRGRARGGACSAEPHQRPPRPACRRRWRAPAALAAPAPAAGAERRLAGRPPPDEPARGAGARRPLHALVPSLVQSQDGGSEAVAGASPPVAAPLADRRCSSPPPPPAAAAAAAGAPGAAAAAVPRGGAREGGARADGGGGLPELRRLLRGARPLARRDATLPGRLLAPPRPAPGGAGHPVVVLGHVLPRGPIRRRRNASLVDPIVSKIPRQPSPSCALASTTWRRNRA